eukprot:gene8742-690_t
MSKEQKVLVLDGETLTIEELVEAGYDTNYVVKISKEAGERVNKARKVIDDMLKSGETRYGINTGFGHFSSVKVSKEKVLKLQINLIRSHCCGVGEPLTVPRTRMLMILRVNALLKGFSGIRLCVLETYVECLNLNLVPRVPLKGTVGASGDLAPLSHVALGMLGEGKMYNPKTKQYGLSKEIMEEFKVKPISLEAKEGLSLINGTQFMSALASEAVYRCKRLVKQADIVAALTVEALHGSYKAFDARIHKNRPHTGQILVAERMRNLLAKTPSEINDGHKKCGQVQDSYTLRCIPQVHGVVNDTLEFVEKIISTEINSATDNPMVFAEDLESDLPDQDNIVSCGNFHGEYPAKACDYLAIGIHELASISERRSARLIDSSLHPHLPSFLVVEGGLNSGFMMIQVTAAALVSENKVLVHPSSSDSIPTSCNKEDHVSMGGFAARKLLEVVENVENVVAIELLCAVQALSFSKPSKTTPKLEKVHDLVRKHVTFYDEDRPFDEDVEKLVELLKTNEIWNCISDLMEKSQ